MIGFVWLGLVVFVVVFILFCLVFVFVVFWDFVFCLVWFCFLRGFCLILLFQPWFLYMWHVTIIPWEFFFFFFEHVLWLHNAYNYTMAIPCYFLDYLGISMIDDS